MYTGVIINQGVLGIYNVINSIKFPYLNFENKNQLINSVQKQSRKNSLNKLHRKEGFYRFWIKFAYTSVSHPPSNVQDNLQMQSLWRTLLAAPICMG